jgi:1-acyl-sn-glycerol-3-phosphate acyltransferase
MLYRAGLGIARMLLGTLRVRRLLTGVTNIPDAGGAVLAITHFGYLEFALVGIVVWLRTRRPIRFLVTSTAFEKPVIGAVLRRAQQIPVDLSAGGDAYNEAVLALRSGALVGVFPEGGVDASFTVRKLKTGAVRLARGRSAGHPDLGVGRTAVVHEGASHRILGALRNPGELRVRCADGCLARGTAHRDGGASGQAAGPARGAAVDLSG